MSAPVTMNIALDASAIVFTLTVFALKFHNIAVNKRYRYISSAFILQLFSLCQSIFIELTESLQEFREIRGICTAVVLIIRLIILALIICRSVMESDGKVHFFHKKEPVSIPILLAALLPVFAAAVLRIMNVTPDLFGIALSLSLVAVCELSEYHRYEEIEDREQTLDIRQAKLMAEQMQPHFIYNSLMSIEYLIYSDHELAAKKLEDFTEYLRGNIDALTSEEPITFSVEAEHIRQYASLERASRDISFELEFDLKAEDFPIPALTVQPIAENAVKYGALSREDGSGVVKVSTEEHGDYVKITVEDNGIKGVMTDKQQTHRSTGIANAKMRLSSQCSGSLNITGNENGTRAVILIPKNWRK